MLLRWDVENPGQVRVMPTPMPTWDGVGYVPSYALPTFRSGDLDAAADGPPAEDPPAEDPPEEDPDTITINRAEYDSDDGEWSIRGRSSESGGQTVEVWLGTPGAGGLIRTATVRSDGRFKISTRSGPDPTLPGAADFITAVSSLGGEATRSIKID